MLLLGQSVLLMLAGQGVVVVVTIKAGLCRLANVPFPPSFSGVDTLEDVGNVDPFSDRRLRLASSVQMTLRLCRIAR